MPQSMALAKGARITGGVFCLLFFLFTAYWLAADAGEFGIGGLWQAWARQRAGLNQATAPFHVGLAAVQLAAALAAFAGRRVAGGLLAGMRSWPRRTPTDPPKRPARTPGLAAGLLLGVMVLWNLVWQGYIVVQSDSASLPVYYLGKGILGELLSMAPGWSALVFLVLMAVATLSSLIRGTAARGLAVGLAVQALPSALVTTIALAGNGTLFETSSVLPGLSIIGDVGLLLDLFGSAALLALTVRGEPVAPAWFAPAAGPQFAAPGFAAAAGSQAWPAGPQAPQAGLQAPPPGPPAWQPPVGGPVAPVGGPPVPPPGVPPMPPGIPTPPQGGFGPPQY
ncbi:hypothetical protein ACFXPQ_29360 [Streptomyces lydicus]|uniref:hypothetical protein n=1 Tax=Streptomyces lydicus TaxID=47763 RepID=UPI0036ACA952